MLEHHGGGKVIDDDGHVIEFGVTTVDGLGDWFGNRYEVLVDRGGVRDALEQVARKVGPDGPVDDARESASCSRSCSSGWGGTGVERCSAPASPSDRTR